MKKLLLIFLFPLAASAGTPVDGLIERVAQGGARNIETRIAPSEEDFFEIAPRGRKIIITGNTAVNVAVGFNWYLKYVANVHISWNNLTQQLPKNMPLPKGTIRKTTDLKLRYYLNFCTFSYSMAFWDWGRWQQEIDWMAMHGVNMPLDIIGNDVVWHNILKRVGYDNTDEFIAGPAFEAWWQMNNLTGWGGPNPEAWYDHKYRLQLKMLARMRELGMQPVFPGYSGMTPRDFDTKAGFQIEDTGLWCDFPRPALLSPEDPRFGEFADIYYEEMARLYGTTKYYAMDPFHEGGRTEGIDLAAVGQTVMAAMKRANPDAVWVAQSWGANPHPAMIEALDKGDLLILDLMSELRPKSNSYRGHDWLFCMLLNFGGRSGLLGRMDYMVDGFYKSNDDLRGVGATPEAIENNPVMFELLYELPWRDERFDPREWLDGYLTARYGKLTDDVRAAWDILYKTSYNTPQSFMADGAIETVICARPGINVKRASTWGSAEGYYDYKLMERAASLMSMQEGNNNFRYDLIDIQRQALADRANHVSEEFSRAYTAGDMVKFRALSEEFMAIIDEMNTLLAGREEFRLDTWTNSARTLIPAHADWLEWNALTLITTWGPRNAANTGGLHDYSSRQWHGLLDLYALRWQTFFNAELSQRGSGANIDWFALEENFINFAD